TLSRIVRFIFRTSGGFLALLLWAAGAGAQTPADFPVARVLGDVTDPATGAKRPLASRSDTGLELVRESYAEARGNLPQARQKFRRHLPAAPISEAGLVLIDAVAQGSTDALVARLRALGGVNLSASGRVVSGWVPLAALDALGQAAEARFARPA